MFDFILLSFFLLRLKHLGPTLAALGLPAFDPELGHDAAAFRAPLIVRDASLTERRPAPIAVGTLHLANAVLVERLNAPFAEQAVEHRHINDVFVSHAQVAVGALQRLLDLHVWRLAIQSLHFLGEILVHMLILAFASVAPERLHGALILTTVTH